MEDALARWWSWTKDQAAHETATPQNTRATTVFFRQVPLVYCDPQTTSLNTLARAWVHCDPDRQQALARAPPRAPELSLTPTSSLPPPTEPIKTGALPSESSSRASKAARHSSTTKALHSARTGQASHVSEHLERWRKERRRRIADHNMRVKRYLPRLRELMVLQDRVVEVGGDSA